MPMVEQATFISKNDDQDFGWISAATLQSCSETDRKSYDYLCRECGISLVPVVNVTRTGPFFRVPPEGDHGVNCGYSDETLRLIHDSDWVPGQRGQLAHLPSIFRFIDEQKERAPGQRRDPTTILDEERPTRTGRTATVSTIATLAIYYRQVKIERRTQPDFDAALAIKGCPGKTYTTCFKTIKSFRADPKEDLVHVYAGVVKSMWEGSVQFRVTLSGSCNSPDNESIQIVIPKNVTPKHLLKDIMNVASLSDPKITIFFYALGSFKRVLKNNQDGSDRWIYEMKLSSSRLIYASKLANAAA